MTSEQAKILLKWMPLVQAIADGRKLQARINEAQCWLDLNLITWDMDRQPPPAFWRIKPEHKLHE